MVEYWKTASGGQIINGLKKPSIYPCAVGKYNKNFKRLYFHHNFE